MQPLVTVVTATTGNPLVKDTINSVIKQTYKNVQHLIFVDGEHSWDNFYSHHMKTLTPAVGFRQNIIRLPYSVGKDRFNGHRMYGAGTFIADGDYIMFLDDDNFIEPTHIEECLNAVQGNQWCFSFRKIVDKQRNFICNDDCESLGLWPSVLHMDDYFVDVNCFFLSKYASLLISPVWYRKFREPGVMEIDRAIMQALRSANTKYTCTKNYTVNYTVGNTENSVKADFFIKGNQMMLERYGGDLPWKRKGEEYTITF